MTDEARTFSAGAHLTGAEVVAASALTLFASVILIAYGLDGMGVAFTPARVVLPSLVVTAVVFSLLRRDAIWVDTTAFAGVATGMLACCAWIARPEFLPPGHGDLAHHLLLIDYIAEHWRLVHDPAVEARLGEMIHYTPGGHILVAMVAGLAHTDLLHAYYPVTAATVALKAGFVFLIAMRLLPPQGPRVPFAIFAVLLLFAPNIYFLGSFAHDSFFAQVVSELFAVAMWWALVVWDEQGWIGAAALFALAGIAAFLTWPIWIGAPMLAFFVTAMLRAEAPFAARLPGLAVATLPVVAVAGIYIAGRIGWIAIARTSGAVVAPAPREFGVWFLVLSMAGLVWLMWQRRGRSTVMFVAAGAAQTAVLYVLAKRSGADTAYMALKMFYLAIYPLAVAAAVLIGAVLTALFHLLTHAGPERWSATAFGRTAAAAVVVAVLAIARTLAAAPPPTPVVTEPLQQAGEWARSHVAPGCIEYLVDSDDTAYWLHLVVLGNPRMSARSGDIDTYNLKRAIFRWLTPGGLPYAIADLQALPRDVRDELHVLARFGPAVVARRSGASECSRP